MNYERTSLDMHPLYPAIKCYNSDLLTVSSKHKIYFEESGNKDGIPVLVLHHGPGAAGTPFFRRFFDPEKYRIILMDQRGSGKSNPFGHLEDNNTNHLLEDMDKLRDYLFIDKWVIFGCGWGATLGLLYAQKYPKNITRMLLVGTQLGRMNDIEWFYQHGANIVYPDYWQEFISHLKPQELGNVVHAYHQYLNGNDDLIRMSMAKSWAMWHANCLSLQPHQQIIDLNTSPHHAFGLALMQTHYLVNHFFIQENQILDNVKNINEIGVFIIHGRYDMVSPLQSAWLLHNAWDNSKLFIIRDAGHSALEPGLVDGIIVASNLLYKELES